MDYIHVAFCKPRWAYTALSGICIELESEKKVAKTKMWVFSKINIILSDQVINVYSNKVKNRHVKFGDSRKGHPIICLHLHMVNIKNIKFN